MLQRMIIKKVFIYIGILGSFLWSSFSYAETKNITQTDKQLIEIQKKLEQVSKKFVEKNCLRDIKILWDDENRKEKFDSKKIIIGVPFLIYEPDKAENQYLKIYYPIFYENKCLGVVDVMQINGEWTSGLLPDNSLLFDEMNYRKEDIIFYQMGSEIIAESKKKTWIFDSLIQEQDSSQAEKKFANKSWIEKVKEIYRSFENLNLKQMKEDKSNSNVSSDNIVSSGNKLKGKSRSNVNKHEISDEKMALLVFILIIIVLAILYRKKEKCKK